MRKLSFMVFHGSGSDSSFNYFAKSEKQCSGRTRMRVSKFVATNCACLEATHETRSLANKFQEHANIVSKMQRGRSLFPAPKLHYYEGNCNDVTCVNLQ